MMDLRDKFCDTEVNMTIICCVSGIVPQMEAPLTTVGKRKVSGDQTKEIADF